MNKRLLKGLQMTIITLIPLAGLHAATSELSAVWYARNFNKAPLKKILVIGLSEDPVKRESFENSFVEIIRSRGGKADTGLAVLPPEKKMTKEVIKAAMKSKGFDAVMVSRLYGAEVKTEYVPGATSQRPPAPDNPYNGSLDKDYDNIYNTVYTSGYLKESKLLTIQTRIYSSDGEIIWSAESQTFDPLSMTDLVAAMAKAMGRDLSDKGLIAPKP